MNPYKPTKLAIKRVRKQNRDDLISHLTTIAVLALYAFLMYLVTRM